MANIKKIPCPHCGKMIVDTVTKCMFCGGEVLQSYQTITEKKTTLADLQQYSAIQSNPTEVQGPNMDMLLSIENTQAYQTPEPQKESFLEKASMAVFSTKSFNEQWGDKSNPKIKKISCPKCRSENVVISMQTIEMAGKNKSEVRKKSLATRTVNNAGRLGANLATAGLYGVFVPKRSAYKEVGKTKTKVKQQKMAICQNCGKSWRVF